MNNLERCVYCGTDKDITVDHVPPKLLLMRPHPPNLITVPACRACNQSFQKDDEYVRTMLCIDVRASSNAAAQSNLPAVLRSLRRANAKAFVEYLTRQAERSVVLGQDGSPMGQVFELEKVRVNRAGERLVRALHFAETGTPIPDGARLRVGCNTNIRPGDTALKEIAQAMAAFRERRHRYVGTAFGYLAALGPESSAWLIQLYDFFVWIGTVDSRELKEPVPGH